MKINFFYTFIFITYDLIIILNYIKYNPLRFNLYSKKLFPLYFFIYSFIKKIFKVMSNEEIFIKIIKFIISSNRIELLSISSC